jgi:hypothetical protein
MKATIGMTAAALTLALGAPAGAAVIIATGSGSLPSSENVLFNNKPPSGLTIEGLTNQTRTGVAISGGEVLSTQGAQQVQAADGLINTTFTFDGLANQSLGFASANSTQGFNSAAFRIVVGNGTATQATLTFLDTAGQKFTETFAIPSNGFFNATAMGGPEISSFSFAANGSFDDVQQIRVGGISTAPIAASIPEPASWALMILGIGGLGVSLRARRGRRLALLT